MQALSSECNTRCNVRDRQLDIVYSTDPLGSCPTFLHLHDKNGSCMPDTITTSSIIIRHFLPYTNTWEFFYLTANLRPICAHGTDDARAHRPMRLGRCMPVGVKPSYHGLTGEYDIVQEPIDLVHIHKFENETQASLESRISMMTGFVMTVEALASVSEIHEEDILKIDPRMRHDRTKWPASPLIAVERYQLKPYFSSEFTFNMGWCRDDVQMHIPLLKNPEGVINIAGSDSGCMVRYCDQSSPGSTYKQIQKSKFIGIVGTVGMADEVSGSMLDMVFIRPMSVVIKDLPMRLKWLFPEKENYNQ
ncbi:hypothetical protein F5Y19DRAFT_429434 [Xylariaceae sp. FL1651]|nr:hypothetical protein F5Y19DRAFT_429434 [Xylariaceae sp. FL1651]